MLDPSMEGNLRNILQIFPGNASALQKTAPLSRINQKMLPSLAKSATTIMPFNSATCDEFFYSLVHRA